MDDLIDRKDMASLDDYQSIEKSHGRIEIRKCWTCGDVGWLAQKIATLVRNHWRIENELHWTLDVCFNENQCRVRIENAAENLARIRRISLLLLKNDKTCKLGIKSKHAKAGYDRNYMPTLLGFTAEKAGN